MDTLLSTLQPGPSVLGLTFYPSEPNHFVVQSSDGRLLHQSRFGNPGPPKQFLCDETPSAVTTVSFSPHYSAYFLAGCVDGSVRLYKDSFASPLITWAAACMATPSTGKTNLDFFYSSNSIVQCQWSPQRPSVFFVLDSSGAFHAFDCLQDDKSPVLSVNLGESKDRHPVPTKLSFTVGQYSSFPAYVAFTAEGRTELRQLSPSLTKSWPNEPEAFLSFLSSAF